MKGRHWMRRWLRLGVLAALCVTLLLCGSLEVWYQYELSKVPRLPSPPSVPPPPLLKLTPVWQALGGPGEMTMPRVYPWNAFLLLRVDRPRYLALRLADEIALVHLKHLEMDAHDRRYSRLQRTAVVVWISRHWTARQVVAWHFAAGAEPADILNRIGHTP